MTSVQTTTIQAESSGREVKKRRAQTAEGADFRALFALFAQRSTLGTARNGSLSLKIGSTEGGRTSRTEAQQSTPRQGNRALKRTDLRKQAGGVHNQDNERLSDRLARAARESAGSDRVGRHAGDAENPSQNTGVSDRIEGRRGASGRASGAQPDGGKTANTEAGRPGEGNTAGIVASSGAVQAQTTPGASAATNAVSAIHAGSNAGASNSQGANPLLVLGGQLGQTRQSMKAAASQRNGRMPSPTPKEAAAFRIQLAQGLGAALRSGRGEVTLRLHPSTLGELQVRVQVKDSAVDAQIRPSTVEAHRLLTQSVDALRHSFEARGLQIGRIEIEQPPASKEGSGGTSPQGHWGGQDGQLGMGREREGHLSKDSTAGHAARFAGGNDVQHVETEEGVMSTGYGSPGIVYSVADGVARIVMIDALA